MSVKHSAYTLKILYFPQNVLCGLFVSLSTQCLLLFAEILVDLFIY